MAAPAILTVFHLRRARDLIDRQFAEPLDLDAMAAAAGFSRYHFARAFKAAYGQTPGSYLTRRRVERAQDLLRTTAMTVTDVCHAVGFASLGTFSRTFTDLVGARPSTYRLATVAPVPACYAMAWGLPAGSRDAGGQSNLGQGDGDATVLASPP